MRSPQDAGTDPRAAAPRSVAVRLLVTLAFVACLVGSVIGVGAFGGTPIAEAADGALSADATHLAPASPAFSVWSVIYTGLGAWTLWQWWLRHDRRRVTGLAVASILLNAAWILSVQAGFIWLSVAVIVVLLAVLALLFARLVRSRPESRLAAVVTDGTFGLYLGWVSVATCANVAAALAASGFDGGGAPEVWAVGVLAAVAAVGVALALYGRGRLAPAATIVWGLVWIALARSGDEPRSTTVAVAAVVAAGVVAVTTLVLRVLHERSRLARHGDAGVGDLTQVTGARTAEATR